MNNVNNYFVMKWYKDHVATNKGPKKYLLWIDDLRGIPNNYIGEYHTVIARSYNEAIHELHRFRYDIICLDHDLGEEKTGYDICKYIIENNIHCNEYRIHTSNPVGRDNMLQLLRNYCRGSVIRVC